MKTQRPLKGVVLAAGLGTRLRPLTDLYPKPLIPFCGTTPLELAVKALHDAGINEVAINAHWLPEHVQAFARRNPFRQKLHVSVESPEILGTGGVYNPLRAWQGDADLLVLNGDIVADFDLAGLIARHHQGAPLATLALLPQTIPGENAVWYKDQRVRAIGKPGAVPADSGDPGNFACVQIITRAFVETLPPSGVFDVRDYGWIPALKAGREIAGFMHRGSVWHDLRSPSFYWEAVKDRLQRQGGRTVFTGSESVDPKAELGPFVSVEPGARVDAGTVIRHAVLLPGAHVRAGETIDHAIVGPDGLRIALA